MPHVPYTHPLHTSSSRMQLAHAFSGWFARNLLVSNPSRNFRCATVGPRITPTAASTSVAETKGR